VSDFASPGTVLTGDSISSTSIQYTFSAPSDLWIQELIDGMLFDLTNALKFTQGGAVTPMQAAQVFADIYEGLTTYSQIGTIIEYGAITLPANALPCDGASYLRTDYQALFDVIGVIWGSADSSHFNVPDLRGRDLLGAGSGPGLTPRTIADLGGEEAHQITISELASHNHTDSGHAHSTGNSLLLGTSVPPPLDALGPNPLPTSTGSGSANIQNTGGDVPHNNMQPFTVVQRGILFA
jgi:microcystin-dependent protein